MRQKWALFSLPYICPSVSSLKIVIPQHDFFGGGWRTIEARTAELWTRDVLRAASAPPTMLVQRWSLACLLQGTDLLAKQDDFLVLGQKWQTWFCRRLVRRAQHVHPSFFSRFPEHANPRASFKRSRGFDGGDILRKYSRCCAWMSPFLSSESGSGKWRYIPSRRCRSSNQLNPSQLQPLRALKCDYF